MSNCQGCESQLPDGAAYCPRCGLGAGAPAAQVPTWRPEPPRPPATPPPPADTWAGPSDTDAAETLAATPPPPRHPSRRRVVVVAASLLALAAAAIVGIDQARGGKGTTSSAPTQSTTSLPPQVRGGEVSPIFPGQKDLVAVAPGVQDSPALAATVDLLTRYFTAINSHHDYEGWARTLVPRPGRATAEQYAGYKTTLDSDVVIHGIRVDRNSNLRVDVSFISHQDPRPGSLLSCFNWEMSYTLVPSSTAGLRIDLVGSDNASTLSC